MNKRTCSKSEGMRIRRMRMERGCSELEKDKETERLRE